MRSEAGACIKEVGDGYVRLVLAMAKQQGHVSRKLERTRIADITATVFSSSNISNPITRLPQRLLIAED
jgi:hypothetical protein